jgi:myo-inositol-1(or 4)-monophosphatase
MSSTSAASAPPDPAALLDLAKGLALEAGAVLLEHYGRVVALATKSSGTDPVSQADLASEQLIVGALRSQRPDDGLLGEEGANTIGTSGLQWVIDPLDGTVNYLYGLGAFAVSIAVQDAEGALAGVVHDPLRGTTYTAVRGRGAWCDDTLLGVNDPVPLDAALVGTGFGYRPERRARQGAMVAALLPRVRDVRRIGSAALDLCFVAAGKLDGYVELGLQPWDAAAGALVAAEAGAVVTRQSFPAEPDAAPGAGDPVRYLAAGATLHRELTAALDEIGDQPG